jgi:hypothetical protein
MEYRGYGITEDRRTGVEEPIGYIIWPSGFLRVNLGQFILDLSGCDGKFIWN